MNHIAELPLEQTPSFLEQFFKLQEKLNLALHHFPELQITYKYLLNSFNTYADTKITPILELLQQSDEKSFLKILDHLLANQNVIRRLSTGSEKP